MPPPSHSDIRHMAENICLFCLFFFWSFFSSAYISVRRITIPCIVILSNGNIFLCENMHACVMSERPTNTHTHTHNLCTLCNGYIILYLQLQPTWDLHIHTESISNLGFCGARMEIHDVTKHSKANSQFSRSRAGERMDNNVRWRR